MPYTNAWSDIIPADASLADLLGADIRQLRLDLHQRMNTGLIVDWTTDPVVCQDGIIGKVTGAEQMYGFAEFQSDQNSKTNAIAEAHTSLFAGSGNLYCALRLPVGCVITQLDWNFYVKNATHITARLMKNVNAAGAQGITQIDTTGAIADTGNFQIVTRAALNYTVTHDFWFFEVACDGGAGTEAWFAGVKVTFTRDLTSHAT